MPILPLFTSASLGLMVVVQTGSSVETALASHWALAAGLACIVSSGAFALCRRAPSGWTYDLFAFGSLLVWFAYWRVFFRLEAPLFRFYPMYFALLTCVLTMSIVNRWDRFDAATIEHMAFLYHLDHFRAPVLAGVTLASLYFPDHFVLYPILLSLVMLRYALGACLAKATASRI